MARLKLAGNTKQKKNCTKGYSCQWSCISRAKGCSNGVPAPDTWNSQKEGGKGSGEDKGGPIPGAGELLGGTGQLIQYLSGMLEYAVDTAIDTANQAIDTIETLETIG